MRVVLSRALTVLASLVLMTAAVSAGTLWHDGYRLYAVASASMAPYMAVGDLVITEPPTGTYEIGDVLTFPSPRGAAQDVTTHRLVAVDGELLETQGDAVADPDPTPTAADDVVGRVIHTVPGAGYVLVFFQQPTGVLGLLTSAVMLLLLWDLFFGTTAQPVPAPTRSRPTSVSDPLPAV